MLSRLPGLKRIYTSPENDKHRKVIEAGIAAQQPIIDEIIMKGMHGHHENKGALRNCVALFEAVRKSSIIPVKPGWDFVEFAYLVAIEFDSTPKQIKIAHGIPEEYSIPSSGPNALFSLRNSSTLNMGRLIKRAKREIDFIPILKALNDMKVAILNAERPLAIMGITGPEKQLKLERATRNQMKELAIHGITNVQIDGSNLSYVLTRTRVDMPDFDEYVEEKGSYIDSLMIAMAKRLSFGFNPKIADLQQNHHL
ncbi:hypothetical protein JXA56_04560 [Candidatus Micrarchaeota archaeon]|nr:hypothetical protein [Candidatus Micrarchaeota archaeon]